MYIRWKELNYEEKSKFNSTPSMCYLKDGKIIDELIESKSEEVLDDWAVKNKIDPK